MSLSNQNLVYVYYQGSGTKQLMGRLLIKNRKIFFEYDAAFSSGPSGEHSTMIMGEGKSPTKAHLLKLAGTCNIKQDKASEIIHQVLAATEKWDAFASEVGVSKLQTKNIGEALRTIRKNSFYIA